MTEDSQRTEKPFRSNRSKRTKLPREDALDRAQPLDGSHNSGYHHVDGPVSVYFCETSLRPIVLHNRFGQSDISAHALRKDFLSVIGSLYQSRTLNVTDSADSRRFRVDVVDRLADRAIPAPGNPAQ